MMADVRGFTDERTKRSGGILVAVLGALLIALVAAWLLLLRTPAEDDSAPVLPPQTERAARGGGGGSNDAGVVQPGRGPVETFQVFASRDPFAPLVGGAASEDAGDSADTSTDGTSGAAESGEASVGGHRVTMVDIFESKGELKAQVQVDDVVYTVGEDDTFADNFQLLSISGECGSLLFGDDQFTLCEGQQILK